jgi:outer membrane protein OmpA-like peptidoglycan-associated protein
VQTPQNELLRSAGLWTALILSIVAAACGGSTSTTTTEPGSESYRDLDGDGYPDADDQCPEEPENIDGIDDDDGCPDRPREGEGAFAILDVIAFENGSAEPAGRHGPVVEAVAETLEGNPEIELLEVRGHRADPDDGAGGLGLRRAEAVIARLTAEGIAATRLRAIDLDVRCPAEDGEHRRVDFRFARLDSEQIEYEDECARRTEEDEQTSR